MTSIELRIRSTYDSLSNAERKVADYFMHNVENVFNLPIATLAEEAGVSKVAWVRFCKAIGFQGIKDLKKALFNQIQKKSDDTTAEPFADIREVKDMDALIESIKLNSVRAIQDTAEILDADALEKAAQMILDAKTVRIFGIGASALVGEDLSTKLMRINKNSYFSLDHHIQLTYAASMSPDDVAVLISMSGKTKEILEILTIAKQNQTPTIALTKYGKTLLALNADTVLYLSAPEISMRSAAMSSRLAQLMVIDALFTAVAHKDYDSISVNLEKSQDKTAAHRVNGGDSYRIM